ncbi:5,10-methylenetetrahydromethanopterin reductase [Rhodococcus aetherivorans]|uniref:5,10-methylenetetrahydromethanopterin reductase n=1 Tax=Rhodococcus aetherivorans TaxID=191292 RepID=A0ABQ0YMC7_9NOCA|nr:LLM class F420-dependent oxidoreductase [Rhodococcus aetherivorans]ETT25971.1 putative oxidoreductase [Rhodococcus rhodochrous ATCC 21198]MDV6294602.1 LLM class F420-dependent oxidoreductase [Rhodococcus aetherivorans]NGP26119.1 LLM class F420-dependent oxidoreductase [Rhodococcus aetherivorans]GES37714.1 5,10-methylenetetrahydromethanopterin reductase [Rhodococcus aetherivorans]
MRVGIAAGYWGSGPPRNVERMLAEAEALGVDSFWTAETYGSDALTPLAWWGAQTSRIKLGTSVCQMSARTPTALAMAAQTLDHLSGGRVIIGIGASGPQVVEGWYGQPYPRPLERTREYIEIMRQVWAREEPVTYSGRHYQLPLQGGSGLGKPLKSIVHPLRDDVPVYMGAEGPKNVALAAEIADGWTPLWFSPKSDEFYRTALAEGFSREGARRTADDFEVANVCWLLENDDVEKAAARLKPTVALYAGGMGAKGANFHNDVFARMGWGEVCAEIQELYLSGRPELAAQAVPTEMVEDVALVGPADKIIEEIETKWKSTCLTTLILGGWPKPENRARILEAVQS